jgi:hypothetical protein
LKDTSCQSKVTYGKKGQGYPNNPRLLRVGYANEIPTKIVNNTLEK